MRRDSDRVLCRTGDSVWSPIFCQDETLSRRFSEGLLHTVAPYNSDPDRDSALQFLGGGGAKDFSMYKETTGLIRGLETCLGYVEDLSRNLEYEDD